MTWLFQEVVEKTDAFASHILKYKYGMNPLTVTWAPHLFTGIGWNNFQSWMHAGGLDNILYTPNEDCTFGSV